ncbi:MAG: hypothetical protein RDV48_04490 [Candidatus Eremiobacteraeota bacterium]|nr:hypothetical protein [Candidatus Eremiobacteraeota bacterium]
MRYEIEGCPKSLKGITEKVKISWNKGKITVKYDDAKAHRLFSSGVRLEMDMIDTKYYGKTLWLEEGARCHMNVSHLQEPLCFLFIMRELLEDDYAIKTVLDDGTELDRWPTTTEIYGPIE